MLEHDQLRLAAWSWIDGDAPATLPAACWGRRVDAADGALLGWICATRGGSWWGLGPRLLEVVETEDAALVMTIARGWFGLGPWLVHDAEGYRVGSVLGPHLLDAWGFRGAVVVCESPTHRVIRGLPGQPLASWTVAADGALGLRFLAEGAVDPFQRMVLLAAAVVSESLPPRRKG